MGKAVGRPPLEAVRFFEVAGRHQSFAKAARELGVTSGAVAHRVRTLEQYLGVKLFERQSHGLALSVRGQAFLVEVQHTLSALDQTTERFRVGAKAGALKLVAVEAFAEMWLMPRLAAFRSAHPEIVIEFETSLSDHHEVDPARRAFDVWIAFVGSVPRTVQSEVLFEETLVPVCSPAFLAARGRPEHPADLHGWPLLYDLAWDDYWTHWFAAQEAGAPDMSRAWGYRLYSMTSSLAPRARTSTTAQEATTTFAARRTTTRSWADKTRTTDETAMIDLLGGMTGGLGLFMVGMLEIAVALVAAQVPATRRSWW